MHRLARFVILSIGVGFLANILIELGMTRFSSPQGAHRRLTVMPHQSVPLVPTHDELLVQQYRDWLVGTYGPGDVTMPSGSRVDQSEPLVGFWWRNVQDELGDAGPSPWRGTFLRTLVCSALAAAALWLGRVRRSRAVIQAG
ncbi:MAG: hypothetical protein JNM94_01420 [Phycisphaerae bacterium]|nr:hypothetical protein [Phycisphaerae bacterium]